MEVRTAQCQKSEELQAWIGGSIKVKCQVPRQHSGLQLAMQENQFANPEYIKAARMGGSTHDIPKTLYAWKELDNGIIFHRGYGARLHRIMASTGVSISWKDERVEYKAPYPAVLKGVILREYQERAVRSGMKHTQGVIVSPTGSGKTVIALELLRRRGQTAAILVHTQGLLDQWVKVIGSLLSTVPGIIGVGKWVEGQHITVAMLQTLSSRRMDAERFFSKVGTVIIDECHHVPASTFAEVVALSKAKFRYGMTATPKRGDGLEKMIYRLLGEVVDIVTPAEVQQVGGIVTAQINKIMTGSRYPLLSPQDRKGWTDYISLIVKDRRRNDLIVEVAKREAKRHKVLILTDRTDHAESLSGMLPESLLVHGKLPAKIKKERLGQLKDYQITVGTKGLLGEGLDCSAWSVLLMGCPMSGQTPLLQAIGRVIRPNLAIRKRIGKVFDFVDSHPFGLSAYKKRCAVYRKRGWDVITVERMENCRS